MYFFTNVRSNPTQSSDCGTILSDVTVDLGGGGAVDDLCWHCYLLKRQHRRSSSDRFRSAVQLAMQQKLANIGEAQGPSAASVAASTRTSTSSMGNMDWSTTGQGHLPPFDCAPSTVDDRSLFLLQWTSS